MNISLKDLGRHPIWGQAFRPFFLSGACFAFIAVPLWVAGLQAEISFAPYGGILFWHAHEMLFGFVVAIAAGFLLTAVQNWTGIRGLNGAPLAALFVLWFSARLLMAFPSVSNPVVVSVIDVAFLPVCALLLSHPIMLTANYRNLLFLPILAVLSIMNLLTHLSLFYENPQLFRIGINGAVMLLLLLVVIITGRILPMFTTNGTGIKVKKVPLYIESGAIALTVGIALLFITGFVDSASNGLTSTLFAIASLVNFARALYWRPNITWSISLLWSLHLAFWFVPVGFALMSLHYAGLPVGFSTALHSLTAAAFGSVILAMMARISLGHTGRPLIAAHIMSWSFRAIIVAGILRVIVPVIWPHQYLNSLWLIAFMWSFSFVLFVGIYLGILITPRVDGKAG